MRTHKSLWVASLSLSFSGLACQKSAETPPPQPPAVEAEPEPEAEPETELEPEPDLLTELGATEPETPAAPKPEPFEVEVTAVMTGKKAGSNLLMVGVDPRFTIHVEIKAVEPETEVLVPGNYDVMIHSPTRTFRGAEPRRGERFKFKLKVYPDDPNDPHDEVFFSSLTLL